MIEQDRVCDVQDLQENDLFVLSFELTALDLNESNLVLLLIADKVVSLIRVGHYELATEHDFFLGNEHGVLNFLLSQLENVIQTQLGLSQDSFVVRQLL